MADNEIDIDIGLAGNPLEASFKKTTEYMQNMLQIARETEKVVANTAARHSEYQKNAKQLREERLKIPTGDEGIVEREKNSQRMAALTANYKAYNDEIAREISLQRGLSLARGAGERRAGSQIAEDGRTGYQARQAENALRTAVLNIDTTSEQLSARLSIAVTKAAERLITSTAKAMEDSLTAARMRIEARSAQFAVPGYVTAVPVNAAVAAQRAVRAAGTGATLEERDANARMFADAQDENRRRTLAANRIRREAERENADRDRAYASTQSKTMAEAALEDANRSRRMSQIQARAEWDNRAFDRAEAAAKAEYKAADAKMRAEAAYMDRQNTLAANRIRRDAERENKERDNAAKAGMNRLYSDASYEDQQRSRNMARLQTRAEWDNRAFDRAEAAAKAEYKAADTKMRSEAAYMDRQNTMAANRIRRDAERENKERDAAAKAGTNRLYSDAGYENRQRDAEYRAQQNRMYAEAAWENRRRTAAANTARANTPEARQERVDRSNQFRSDLMNSNGGSDMFAFQAKLAANYAIFGLITSAITGSISAIVQFDDALKQFQAITATSNSEMGAFRANLLGVAADSKFSVLELTQVAVALGQTGLAADGVIKALQPVVNLAAASGASLQQSVEAITAVLGAYNMEAGRAGDVADVFVAALNRTKLTMEQLQLGIQYAANIARDSGVSFSELTASIGAMAQAGIRSGSTIGTGLRQLITELSAPTEKLRGVLKELGIDMSEVDLRTQGFTTVLEHLRAKGFGVNEALRGLDLRAASAFQALGGQADKIKLLEQEFLLTSAAAEGAAKANESFTAAGQRLTNVVFGMVDKAFSPLVTILASATSGTANLLTKMSDTGSLLPILAAGIGGIATAFAGIKVVNLLAGFAGLTSITTALTGLGALATGGIGLGIAATGGVIYYLSTIQTEAEKAKQRLDELKGIENGLTARQGTLQTVSQDLDLRIKTLIDRRETLNNDPILSRNAVIDAQKSFGEFGLSVDVGSKSIESLISALQNLRGEMGKEMPVLLAQQLQTINQQLEKLQELQRIRETANRGIVDNDNEVVQMWGGGQAGSALDWLRKLGPQGAEVAKYLDGTNKIDPSNARGPQVASLTSELMSERVSLGEQRNAVALSSDVDEAERARMLRPIDERIKLVDQALKLFQNVISEAASQQALIVARQRVTSEATAKAIYASAGGDNNFKTAFDKIRAQQDDNITAAQKGTSGMGRVEAMQASMRLTDDAVRAKLAEIQAAKDAAEKEGKGDEAKAAFAEVIDLFNALLKSSTKEIRDRFVAVTPAARAALQAQIRTSEAQLALIQKQASTTNNADDVPAMAERAKVVQQTITDAREKLFKLDKGVNADQIIAGSDELKEAMAEIQSKGKADVTRLGITYAEIHRKVQQAALSYQGDRLGERRDVIEEQIKGLTKIRDDVRSTPEQAANAVKEINRLLEQVATILKGINDLKVEKTDLKFPDKVPATYTPGVGGRDALLEMAKASGASEDRIRYLLNSAQIESSYDPRVISGEKKSSAGATGIFQFMPSTWEKMYGTQNVNVDLAAQFKAMQDFTNRNAGTFQSNMGRQASDEELYLMHQQGAGGALALLRDGDRNAVDALRAGGSKAPLAAVTGNGGRADMTAQEFVELILRKYRAAEAKVGDPFGTTGEKAQARSRTLSNDKTSEEIENRKAENARQGEAVARASRLADLKKIDAGLSDTYDNQLLAIRKLQDPATASSANADALKTLGELYRNAQQRDTVRLDREGPDERAKEIQATNDKFAAQFADQGLNTADTIGKAYSKQFTDELTRLQAMRKELERPENEGKEGNTEALNALNEQINLLQKRNELQGPYEQNQAKITALEQTLAEMKKLGLDTDKQTFTIRQKLRDLYGENKTLEPARNLAATQARTERTLGSAATSATDSFLKSRGILDIKGQVADPLIEAQKRIEESLQVMGNAFDSFWVNLTNGSMTAGQALKKFGTDILGGLMSSLSKSITNDLFKMLFTSGETGSASGGGIISMIAGLFGGAKYQGGAIRRAGGGQVPKGDAAEGGRDSKLVLAQPGEYMLRKSAVDAIGTDTLDQVNALGNTMVERQPRIDPEKMRSIAKAETAVYVVDRDQVPVPGPSEMVYAIGQDIMRGGTTKQLIKRVAAGG